MGIDNSGSLALGIDTGGTYTDGVLLDYQSRRVRATAKTLTTRDDLSRGIIEVIDRLTIEDSSSIKLVSISTTLATNSIVEGKGRRVALMLIGYDPDLIRAYNLSSRFATDQLHYFRGGHTVYGDQKEPLDLDGIVEAARSVSGRAEAIAISSYFSPLNPEHEELAFKAVSEVTGLPIVLGHQLSNKLDSVQRATTATLNASLLAVLSDFVAAVRKAMSAHGVTAPLMVVKGDGTLMSAEVAARRPVETVLSGPAASAIGGRYLSELANAIVIDIGGTTTDIIIVRDRHVDITDLGATVGPFRTAVKAANIRSIGLGGDSEISFDREGNRIVGPKRVLPVSYLAHRWPEVEDELRLLRGRSLLDLSTADLEYWYVARPGAPVDPEQPMMARLMELLRDRPRPVSYLLKHLRLTHPLQLPSDTLIRYGVLAKSALTPTDLMHLTGDYAPWSAVAASIVTDLVCKMQGHDLSHFAADTIEQMSEMIVDELVAFLSCQERRLPSSVGSDGYGRWFLDNSIRSRSTYLKSEISLRFPIIGIGAPAGIFLTRVADLLRTELVLPEHFPVANAIGAVSGSVLVDAEALVFPRRAANGTSGYFVQTGSDRRHFMVLDEALAHGRAVVSHQARCEALEAGAADPELHIEELPDGVDSYKVRARAVGNPRLGS